MARVRGPAAAARPATPSRGGRRIVPGLDLGVRRLAAGSRPGRRGTDRGVPKRGGPGPDAFSPGPGAGRTRPPGPPSGDDPAVPPGGVLRDLRPRAAGDLSKIDGEAQRGAESRPSSTDRGGKPDGCEGRSCRVHDPTAPPRERECTLGHGGDGPRPPSPLGWDGVAGGGWLDGAVDRIRVAVGDRSRAVDPGPRCGRDRRRSGDGDRVVAGRPVIAGASREPSARGLLALRQHPARSPLRGR